MGYVPTSRLPDKQLLKWEPVRHNSAGTFGKNMRTLLILNLLLLCGGRAFADYSATLTSAPISPNSSEISGFSALAKTTDPTSVTFAILAFPKHLNAKLVSTSYLGSSNQWTFVLNIDGKIKDFPIQPNSLLMIFSTTSQISIPLNIAEFRRAGDTLGLPLINKTFASWISNQKP